METGLKNKTLVVILGATATGKTNMSVEIARRFSTEIISCDSRQIYREIPIGTAAPDKEQLSLVPHHFIGTRSVTEDYNAGKFEEDALAKLTELFEKHDVVVMTGGSGLYIDAVCKGFDEVPAADPIVRNELNRRLDEEGLDVLVEELRTIDPEYHAVVDRNNPQRVIRALEVCRITGDTYTYYRKGTKKKRPFNIIKIGISIPRDILYDRINRRVDIMIAQGLEEEARGVYGLKEHNALRTVGFTEMFDYFDGKITKEEAVSLIKQNSRRYAKRQTTWFGRDDEIVWFGPEDADEIESFIKESIIEKGDR